MDHRRVEEVAGTMETVRAWLERQGLGQYGPEFERNDVDLDVLESLTEADLETLGVSLGHRKRLLKAIVDRVAGRSGPAGATPAIESTTAAGERRQVTVLFCDLVDSVRLSRERDLEEFRAIMAAYHGAVAQSVQRYEGYVAQIQGDGVVAYFGYPLAHESEADRAVRAGLAIIEALAGMAPQGHVHLSVRVGIATGLAVVSHILAPDKSAVGDTPNLAHRLQGIAAPGEVLITDRVRALAGGAFDYEDRGHPALKGVGDAVRVWRVAGSSVAASRFEAATRHGVTPMVGREQEIGLLLDRWELARAGCGQGVLIVGEPGIGKSRTMLALRERLAEARVARPVQFQCSPYHVNSALYPVIDHFERAVGFSRDDDAATRLGKIEARLTGDWHRSARDCHLVARMLSVDADAHYGPMDLTPQRQKEETLRLLVDMLAGIALEHPTLMLFEDAHWADPTTLELLDLLVRRTGSLPLLLLVSFRPEFTPAWIGESVTLMPLARLSQVQSGHLVRRMTADKPLPDDLVAQIVEKTDGVPLFLEELTKAVLELGLVEDAGSHYRYAQAVDRMTIPATLRDSLMARLDRLIPVKEIAQIGAVIGREFAYDLVAAVSPMKGAALDDALERLVASELVFQRGAIPHAVYTFKHALVQDAAYDSLLKAKRQELHAEIAGVLLSRTATPDGIAPERLAHHYTAAGMISVAVHWWHRAGEHAMRRPAMPEAIAHLERALALNATLPDGPERDLMELEIRSALGTSRMALHGWSATQVGECLQPALAIARRQGRVDRTARILWGLWVHRLTRGRIAEARALANEMTAEAEAIDDEDLRICASLARMISAFWLGALEEARSEGVRVLGLYQADRHRRLADWINSDPKTQVGCYAAHWEWMLGHPDLAVRTAIDKDEHARARGHPFDLGFALTNGAFVFEYRREPERLMQRVLEAERLAERCALPFIAVNLAALPRAFAELRLGRPGTTASILRDSLMRRATIDHHICVPYARAVLGESLAAMGRLDEALREIDLSIEQCDRSGWEERVHYAEIVRLRGSVLERQHRPDEALATYGSALDFAMSQRAHAWSLRCGTSLAALLAEHGLADRARAVLQPLIARFTEGRDSHDLVQAERLLVRLA
jgi:class 3 adenylate cyclase/tetratricopeptide (TPR) repeat protein